MLTQKRHICGKCVWDRQKVYRMSSGHLRSVQSLNFEHDVLPNGNGNLFCRYAVSHKGESLCNGDAGKSSNNGALLYRKWVVSKLVEWTSNVIASLQENVDCFPSSLAWLVRKIADMLSEVYGENSKEVSVALCGS